ncbi:MAG TPA: hypothetical protein VF516_03130 [Kofleriaceae bacterium]
MGAETTYYVQVVKAHLEWVEVQAVTGIEAMKEAEAMQGVLSAVEYSLEKPSDEQL